ncbi:beta-lactamase family protein [Actinomadura barringtoniae]|uniref:Beta-lactamase family protein n=1 Tax=Actinomadura barringtoniae TaxID=1427535 RepID=A0A939TC26_9ACTN|nr:serine hydrolase domain-containing protein [Actinomadura barringtoniae]MBO2450805.1 beta-lactamase family protein [Actinomadura barringtoniae]
MTPDPPGLCRAWLDSGGERYESRGVRSAEDPMPVDEDTLFRVASVSKLITGAAITALGVDVDSAVRDHLPDFRLADADAAGRITVRDLLTHRAGFAPDVNKDRLADELDAGALARAVADLAVAPQISPPGRYYGYSNAGFMVLARIVEVVAGEPFEHAARRLVLEPAGMRRSTYFTDEAVTHPVALGHGGEPPRVLRPWGRSRARNGQGGLMTTARDLIAFARYTLADPGPAWEPLADGFDQGSHVGVAWNVFDLPGGGRAAGHAGHTKGYTARLTLLPDSGRAFVILANSENAGPFLDRETAAALGLPAEPEHEFLAAPDVRDHLGVYTDGSDQIRVDGVPDGVVLSEQGLGRVRFIAPDEGRADHGLLVRFLREDGRVSHLRLAGKLLRKVS